MSTTSIICIGKIIAPHGLRGLVRLRSFADDPKVIEAYAVIDAHGQARQITLKSPMAQEFIAEISGITNREQAEAARGMELFVRREDLPKLGQSEYYLADLVGLRVDDASGAVVGVTGGAALGATVGIVQAVHDFGAGTLLDIKLSDGQSVMLPFRDAFVPVVNIAAGFLTITPPEGWLAPAVKAAKPVKAAKIP
jgi:16S rRNA processing protein RimM